MGGPGRLLEPARDGPGDYLDFSLYEATAQAIEPAMGTVGTAQAAGYEPTRGRPAPGPYPIFRCRDGHVRVVLLAPRQWQAMRTWLGDPDELRIRSSRRSAGARSRRIASTRSSSGISPGAASAS